MFMRPQNSAKFSNPSITRRNLLRGAAGVAGLATLQSSSFVLAAPAPTVTKIKNLVGTQTPVQFGIGGTDLGIPARCPNGRTLWLFGDTFSDVMSQNWRSPVALYSDTTNLASGVTFDGAVGGDRATQLFPYAHGQYDIETVIPSDVIAIGGTMYMHVMVNGPSFGKVMWTGVYKSEDQGESWLWAGVKFPGDKDGGYFTPSCEPSDHPRPANRALPSSPSSDCEVHWSAAAGHGFQFAKHPDGSNDLSRVVLCGAACERVRHDSEGSVDVVLGCASVLQ